MPVMIRAPRLQVKVDGQPVAGAIDATVTSTNYFSADCFQVTLAGEADPIHSYAYWSSARRPRIEVLMSVDAGATYTSLLIGQVDNLSIDPVNKLICLDGRDLSAGMVDSCVQQAFVNQSGSAIVALLALRHGLDIEVMPTPGMVGRLYGAGYDEVALGQYSRGLTEWDVVVRLAQQANYDAYVQGSTFYFQPVSFRSKTAVPLTSDDVVSVRLERALCIPENVTIGLASWNSQTRDSYATAWETSGPSGQYFVSQPNLPSGMINQLVIQYNAELERHRCAIEIAMPGDLRIWPRGRLAFSGTGTSFDRTYDIECVRRSYSPMSGFRQHVRARQTVEAAVLPNITV